GEHDGVDVLHGSRDRIDMLGVAVDELVFHPEVVFRVHGARLGHEVAHVAVRGKDLEILAEVLLERLRLGRRFHDEQVRCHCLVRHFTRWKRAPGMDWTVPWISSLVSRAASVAASRPVRSASSSTESGLTASAASSASPCSSPKSRIPGSAQAFAMPRSDRMSSANSTSFAPSLINLWQPFESVAWIEPGTANTSRFWRSASNAVMSEPLSSAASTTSTPRTSPLMRRLRRGKFNRSGGEPSGSSESKHPRSASSSASLRLRRG